METVTVVATAQHSLSTPVLIMIALSAALLVAIGWHLVARTRI